MKRKLLCLLLCISMVLPNVPMAVLADEAGACEHVGVSEDGTVSGNGVCEVCSMNQQEEEQVGEEQKSESGSVSEKQDSQEKIQQVSGNDIIGKDSTGDASEEILNKEEETVKDNKITTITYIPETDLPNNEELFAGYAEKLLYGYSISTFRSAAGNRLSESEKGFYDYLKEQIEAVAAGTTASTQFVIQDSEKLSLWLDGNSFSTENEIQNKLNTLSQKVTDALLAD